MAKVKVGVVGVNVIGSTHVSAVRACEDIELVGIADKDAGILQEKSGEFEAFGYPNHQQLIEQAKPDYVVVCTPHYSHAGIAIEAMRAGVHVLLEKPMTVRASRAAECLEVARETGMTLGVNFMRRMAPTHRRLFEAIRDGFVGTITRVTMVCTEWFRTMAYYRSSAWRATWKGEGGGVIVNQSPHDLDMLVWTLGMPCEVLCEMNTTGHDIEVEDDVCAVLKWPGGAVGSVQVSTNDAPGRALFEIAGTKGTLTLEGGSLRMVKLAEDSREYSETTDKLGAVETDETVTLELSNRENRFRLMHLNFVEALRKGAPLVCSAAEGLAEVELANALLVSGVKRRWVATPVDAAEYEEVLGKLTETRSVAKAQTFFA